MSRIRDLKKENSILDKRISSEYKKDYMDLMSYLRKSGINQYHQECVRKRIIKKIFVAKESGISSKELFGENIKFFLDTMIYNIPKTGKKERVLCDISLVLLVLIILSIINIITDLISWAILDSEEICTIGITLLDIILSIMICVESIFFARFMKKFTNNENNGKKSKNFLVKGAYVGGIVAFGVVFIDTIIIGHSKDMLFKVPIGAYILICAILFIIRYLIERKLNLNCYTDV